MLLLLVSLLLASETLAAGQFLAPDNDIVSPVAQNAREPLKWAGANGPWFKGENINNISSSTPDNCKVDQAAYISRHGSRYPDEGAYNGWVDMHSRFSSAGDYTARGALSFLPNWSPVLTDPSLQIAMENPTGAKEAHDLGYQLRTRYPDLYRHGDSFPVWANNYTRVLQTAQLFSQGFLGYRAALDGKIVAVTSKGFPAGIGDSLAPSDMCPLFSDSEGADQVAVWNAKWVPAVQKRLQGLIHVHGGGGGGNLTLLTENDITQIPYLCGFESAITGRLSPWCDVFTNEELRAYQYSNDLRYYYGIGPGTDLNRKMMTPYLDALVGILEKGPGGGSQGKDKDGNAFELPKLLVSFLNDGQLVELITATGVFEDEGKLKPSKMDEKRRWVGNRFVTMRGTVAFERLSCGGGGGGGETFIRVLLNDAVYPLPFCRNGPGASCRLAEYVKFIKAKYADEGNWLQNCNVTLAGAPTETVKGASFYTDLTSPWVQTIDVFSPTW